MYEAVLAGRTDLAQFKHNSLLLFALELRFQIEDILTVAAEALTDGYDDKKCDLIYIDDERGCAVIAQGYVAQDASKASAPASKASDLNTAASWMLCRPLEALPQALRPAATALRAALLSKKITSLHFWFVHNLPGSQNVRNELETVEHTARNGLRENFPDTPCEVSSAEVCREVLDEWYKALTTPILVTDTFEIQLPSSGYEVSGEDWRAYVAAVPATWLHDLFRSCRDKLFSANIRGYLGSRRSEANINNGIRRTAESEPNQFWVYNNGITALVHGYEEVNTDTGIFLRIAGISVVNGAQTTGAIGSLPNLPPPTALVPARFVQCTSQSTIKKIIEFNNRQNEVEPSDWRSRDPVQQRLCREFGAIPSVTYLGGRRGGAETIIARHPNLLPSDTAAQALAAFHQNPDIAYHHKSDVWRENHLYARYFSERTTATHIVFAFSLLRCIEEKKLSLGREECLTVDKAAQLKFLRMRGATFLLTAAIAACLENFAGRSITDPFRVSFGQDVSPERGQGLWTPVVELTAPFCEQLTSAASAGMSPDSVRESIRNFRNMVSGMIAALKATGTDAVFAHFAANLKFQ